MSKESSIKVFAENASGTRPANAIPVWIDNISECDYMSWQKPVSEKESWQCEKRRVGVLFFFVILNKMCEKFDKTKKYWLLLKNYCYLKISMIEYVMNDNCNRGTVYECSVAG